MASSSPARPATQNLLHIDRRAVVLVLVGTLIGGVLFTMGFGRVTGREFSPEAFALREFRYYQLPLLSIPLSRVRRKDVSLPDYLVQGNFIKVAPAQNWHLVSATKGWRRYTPHGPEVLLGYLQARDSGGAYYWDRWSAQHPDRASVLWPLVVELARLNLYPAIPDLMRWAEAEKERPVAEFQQRLNEQLAARCLELADVLEGSEPQVAMDVRAWVRTLLEAQPAAASKP